MTDKIRTEPDIHGDAYGGQGGEYLFDPATGERRLVARTQSPAVQTPGTADSEPAVIAPKE